MLPCVPGDNMGTESTVSIEALLPRSTWSEAGPWLSMGVLQTGRGEGGGTQ